MSIVACILCGGEVNSAATFCRTCNAPLRRLEAKVLRPPHISPPYGYERKQSDVAIAIQCSCGQAMLRDLVSGLDQMPVKQLSAGDLILANGEDAALEVLLRARGLEVSRFDPNDPVAIGSALEVAPALVAEMNIQNDEHISTWIYVEICGPFRNWQQGSIPVGRNDDELVRQARWEHMRSWAVRNLKQALAIVDTADDEERDAT